MPLNRVSGLWIIILSLTSEFSCSGGKSYRNKNKEKFKNLAVSTDNVYVYIGLETSLIQLNSSLQFIKQISLQDQSSKYNNWLLAVYKNETLIECSYKLQDKNSPDATRCRNYKLDLSNFDNELKVLKIKQPPATRYITSTVKDNNILMIASSSCLKHDSNDNNCNAISSFVFKNGITEVPSPPSSGYYVTYNTGITKRVDFKTLIEIGKFVYVLFNTQERYSKLGKICTIKTKVNFYPYEDIKIQCKQNTKVYTLAQDAVFWKEHLYVAFNDDSSSVICSYNFTDIKAKFKKSRQDRLKCPYVAGNSYFKEGIVGETFCFNETTQQCKGRSGYTSCPEVTDDNDGFCNTTFFGPVQGNLTLMNDKVIFSEDNSVSGAVVKLGALPFDNHAVIYAGTTTGKIGKIFVSRTDQKVLNKFELVEKSSPVLDIKVLDEDVYVMTQNKVVKVEKKPCPDDVFTCADCMNLTNPICGWDIISKSCIKNPDTSVWWLPSLGGQCLKLKVEDIFIEDSTVSGKKESKNVTFSLKPAIDFYNLNCQYANEQTKAGSLSTGSYSCLVEVTDGPFQLNVTQGPNSPGKDVLIASTTVQPTKCSKLNSCGKCLDNNRCFWCLQESSCVSNTSSCSTNTGHLNHTMGNNCPRISGVKMLIHHVHKPDENGQTENLNIPVQHFDTFELDENKLKCVVIVEDDDDGDCEDSKDCDEYSASIQSPFTNVKCLNVKTPTSNKKLFIKYNGAKIENSVDLEVYECKKFENCGICMYRKNQGYQCKWCPKNKGKKQCSRVKEPCVAGRCTSNTVNLKVDPTSGPEKGGTTITISRIGFGYPGDLTTVVVNGVECTEAMVKSPSVVECKTGNGSSSMTGDIKHVKVTISNISVTAPNLFTYKDKLGLYGFQPNKSIQAGGKKIRIFGNNIGFEKSHYDITFCNSGTKCINCSFIKKLGDNAVQCRMGGSDDNALQLTQLKVLIDNNTKLLFNGAVFKFVPNPEVADSNLKEAKVFKSGGSKITLTGSGFSNVGEVKMDNVNETCTINSDTEVICGTPPFVKSDFDRRKRAIGQNVYVDYDNYRHLSTIYYVEDPKFDKFSNVIEYEEGEGGEPIVIEGSNLLDGAHMEDYIVNIGLDGQCLIKKVTPLNITCLPPKFKPRTNHSDENLVFVIVKVGNIQDNLGNIKYITALPILAMVIGVLGGLLVVAVVLGSAYVLISRRKRKREAQNFQMELINMEDKIRETSREEFADAQMTIRDIKSDLVTSRVPYCNYQSYAFHQLFPNQDMDTHPILFEPMVTDDSRRKVQKAMDMFDKLMTNKLFMKSLVQTLESQNKLSPQDKAQFASLLSVCLIGNMKLFYQLINSLLIDMIKSANKKQQKVLFRRFESITQRLMVNWLALSLYDHLKKNGGMQLFMLYKATQTVIEKAPIDAVTILCKNTLAEERLLKNRVEHEILTLDIDLNGNSDKRIPVIVLDCDTITQVKKKCCTAIYKNQPASEIPTPDELELEWHSGKSGKLTLQDIDSISDRSNGMVRLNTLKHYMVKNGSVMALMYKESTDQDDIYENSLVWYQQQRENQHVQGSVPTSPDHVKLLIPETTTDSQEHKWHLSNLPDEEKSNKEHEIGEIFLNRLFHTKLILRDYIEACFEGITDSQSLSIPVRYFLCMIDKQGKEVGVDGDILQSWKSECYATRVWASLIAKPQILFDVNVPSHVEPCMDILKQVFIDSFTQCPQHVTKDASTQKLLFCKDIPEYRKNVNSFFMKVEAVNDQEFWTAMDEISKEQTRKMKFSRQATLHQLYKFIDKYKDEIIEDFQEKDETKDLAFGNKLEEVIDLMEES